ncbi:hypothetical protein [Bifidobacterium scaligerum]|uniref:hypothetical protein n=1 Tax=Bifidobacterium scaligerum TaxID=2052656 RepID=UPI001055A5F6|nr:hypothetical protein [Bifidobacterium scaligerum]
MKKQAQIIAIETDTNLSRIVEKALAMYVKRYYDAKSAPSLKKTTDAVQTVIREQSAQLPAFKGLD